MRRKKLVPSTIATALSALKNVPDSDWQRAQTLANLLRPTLERPLDHATLKELAKAARLSPASVQRYCKRLMESRQVTVLLKRGPGWHTRKSRLAAEQQAVILREIE